MTLVIVGTMSGAIFSFAAYSPSMNYPLSPANCLTAYGLNATGTTTLAATNADGKFTTFVAGGDIFKTATGIYRNTGL